MAVKKTLIQAVPGNEDGKVVRWQLTMKYEQGTEGEADYYESEKNVTVYATETRPGPNGDETTNNFTAKAEGEWTKKELEDLCPTAKWDAVFASQYDSVITNPPKEPVDNNDFVIPS
tara:strand:+ start:1573 stop:1923 length:351 start_codon:yes stop_codon:yes gene_type:complete